MALSKVILAGVIGELAAGDFYCGVLIIRIFNSSLIFPVPKRPWQ